MANIFSRISSRKSERTQEELTMQYKRQLMEALSIDKLNDAWQIAKKEVEEEEAQKEESEHKRLSLAVK
ncbi:hypothetical protein SAMN05444362_1213 [Dysgonomonas macrotermitis]|uniref:Uncharacterized protein n=2 Tax=Dysgonomonas macrotermitis TaxID=1346286 RepID=A0A1M5ITD6_9BACT|nr:hypothetical protein SAMN05444362_1213 [Dysgonomonas macrotermitis]